MGASDSVNKTVAESGERFSVRLIFPEKHFPTMLYPVHTAMLVSTLRLQISDLLQQMCLVHLLVGISWKEDRLHHEGTISDRFLPGTNIPCPFLQRGTMVLVYLERPASASPGIMEPVPIGLSSFDSAPAVGGWVSQPTKEAIKKVALKDRPARVETPKSDFFDDAYVQGKHVASRDKEATTLNPLHLAPPTYSEVYTAEITTLTDIARHEERIYQPGYTPTAIRENIRSMLRNSSASQPVVDFQEMDTPPSHQDERTFRILADLLRDRNRLEREFQIPLENVAADGSGLGAMSIQDAFTRRDAKYNDLNRICTRPTLPLRT